MYVLRLVLIATTVQLSCQTAVGVSAKDEVTTELNPEVQRIVDLVKEEMQRENEAAKKELRKENEAMQNDFHNKFQILETKNNILEKIVNSTVFRTNDVGRPPADCVIGNNFRYHEFPKSYGSGNPYTLPAAGNRYQCLDLCRLDPTCLAVSFQKTSPHACNAYSEDPAVIDPSNDWDYYRLEFTNSCWLDKPVIEFMISKSTTSGACYNNGDIYPFDQAVYDSGDGFRSDYKYHCPVAGTYRFTLIAVSYDTSGNTWFDIRKNDSTRLARLRYYKTDGDETPGSVEVYASCEPGDTISVVSAYTSSCVYGGGTYLFTTLSGRLVDLL